MATFKDLERKNPQDPAIRYTLHVPAGDPAGCVLLTHGYAEHSGRYAHVVDAWLARGLAVATWDLRGHGTSDGPRGHVQRFSEYLRDAIELIDTLDADPAWTRCGTPMLFGHSLGGLITFHLAASHPKRFRGVALTSPFFGLALEVPVAKRIAGQLFSKVLPKLALSTGLKGEDVTRDKAIAAAYDKDPLHFPKATARWFTEVQSAQADAKIVARDFRLPIYCLQGGDDKVVSKDASRQVIESVASADKTYVIVEGGYHEVLNDPGKEKLVEQIADRFLGWAK